MYNLRKFIKTKKQNKVYRYSIRRLSIGVVSCVVGAFVLFGPVNFGKTELSSVVYANEISYEKGWDFLVKRESDQNLKITVIASEVKRNEENVKKMSIKYGNVTVELELTNDGNYYEKILNNVNEDSDVLIITESSTGDKKEYIAGKFSDALRLKRQYLIHTQEYLNKKRDLFREKLKELGLPEEKLKEITKKINDSQIEEEISEIFNKAKFLVAINNFEYLSDEEKEIYITGVETSQSSNSVNIAFEIAKERNEEKKKIAEEISELKHLNNKDKEMYIYALKTATGMESAKISLELAQGKDEAAKAVNQYRKRPIQKNFEKAYDLTNGKYEDLYEKLIEAATYVQKATDNLTDAWRKEDKDEAKRQKSIIQAKKELEDNLKKEIENEKKKEKDLEEKWKEEADKYIKEQKKKETPTTPLVPSVEIIPAKPLEPAKKIIPAEKIRPIVFRNDNDQMGSIDWRYIKAPSKDAKTEVQKQKTVIEVKVTIGSDILQRTINNHTQEIKMDTKAIIKDGRTMLPIRYVAEALGYTVEWREDTRTAILKDKNTTIEIPVDTNKIIVNGKEIQSDVKPMIENGRTMLPIANVARALGLKDGQDIKWDEAKQEVTIRKEIIN